MMMELHNKISGRELKKKMLASQEPRTTLSFYRYARIGNPNLFRDHLYLLWQPLGVLGRTYVAMEGINAQISVPNERWEDFRRSLDDIVFLRGVRLNIAIEDNGKSFFKLAIKARHKIVADGLNDSAFDVTNKGKHLSAEEFNRLSEQPGTVIVDMRNYYESEVGHFKGAVTPPVTTFREALQVVEDLLQDKKTQNIIMYCTGGIRCEKASAYYKHRGFQNVFQVEGGIIEYARQVKNQGLENKFIGKNFVFDERLGERISGEIIAHCHQCGEPADVHINCANDACHLLFIQCPACAEKYEGCCSAECRDFTHLPAEEQKARRKTSIFNGSKFPEGHYRAFRSDEGHLLE